MKKLAFDPTFFEDLEQVDPASKQDEILDTIEMLLTVPEMGSTRLPASVMQEFGPNVRKLAIKPFLVVYELMEDGDLVYIHGLMHGKRAW